MNTSTNLSKYQQPMSSDPNIPHYSSLPPHLITYIFSLLQRINSNAPPNPLAENLYPAIYLDKVTNKYGHSRRSVNKQFSLTGCLSSFCMVAPFCFDVAQCVFAPVWMHNTVVSHGGFCRISSFPPIVKLFSIFCSFPA